MVMFGLAVAGIGYFYQNEREVIKPSYVSVLEKVLGDV